MNLVTFYDACTPANIPANAKVVCAYLDGVCANLAAVKARFPLATVVTITTRPVGDLTAAVYDCESGDGTPEQAAQWCKQKIDGNHGRPTVYTTASNWSVVVAALQALGVSVASVDWWEAHWDGIAQLSPGSVAKQYGHPGLPLPANAGYDISVANPAWSVLPQGLIAPGSFADKTPPDSRPKTFPKTVWLRNPLLSTGDVTFLRLCLNQCPGDKVPHFKHPGWGGYGKKTADAVIDFQRWQGLTPNGICSPQVWVALGLRQP